MSQAVSSRNVFASPTPLVVGVISSAATLSSLIDNNASPGCDLLELRLDMISLPAAEVHELAKRLPLPLLVTARHPDEGGHGGLDTAQRTALLQSFLDIATIIDIELRSAPEMLALIKTARSRRVHVLGSFHDFAGTPSGDVLHGAADFAIQCGFDAAKFATTLRGPGDLARLLTLIEDTSRKIPVSVMGMGPLGAASRIALARCGSVLNYGYLGESNAPGQISAPRMKQLLAELV
jgi:3-dehydroquinate dehydratase-1